MMICWGEGEENKTAFSETECLSLSYLGECCVVLTELSIRLSVNALLLKLPALLVASLVVRWLLYNVHSLIFNMCDCYCCLFVLTIRGDGLNYTRKKCILIRGIECSKTHNGISLFSFPRKWAGINPSPPSNVLGIQLALRGVQWFYCTASICARHLYTATVQVS